MTVREQPAIPRGAAALPVLTSVAGGTLAPMRVCLVAWGSRGDVAPMVALGVGLRDAGLEVTVAAGRDFTSMIESAGLRAQPFGLDVGEAVRSPDGRAWLAGSSAPWREGARIRALSTRFAEAAADGFRDVLAGHDAVVSGILTHEPMLTTPLQAQGRHVLALFAPLLPTMDGRVALTPVRRTRIARANAASGRALLLGLRRAMRPANDLARTRVGLPRLGAREYLRTLTATPTLLAASPLVVPPARDTRRAQLTTGSWSPRGSESSLPGALEDFLAAGPPPVYLGFGSMPAADEGATLTLLTDAARLAGRRAVVHGSWAGRQSRTLGDDVLVVGDVPHERLFPRVDVVVHHGGAGTTGTAVRAGAPQVVVPHMGDQPFWARRVQELGIGLDAGRRHRLDADRLARAVRAASTPAVRAEAAGLADRVSEEDGVATAVEHLIRLWCGPGARHDRRGEGR